MQMLVHHFMHEEQQMMTTGARQENH